MFFRLISLLAFCLAIAFVSGCGSSSGSEESSLTKAAFVRKATALCKAHRKKDLADAQALYVREQKSGVSPQELSVTAVTDLVVPRLQSQTEEIRALGAPQGDEDQVEAILTAVEEVLDEAEEDPEAYLTRLANYKRPFHHAHTLAKIYGIPACART